MKKLDLGQIITILANIGVIAGIVLLAVELDQNNRLIEAAAGAAGNQRIEDGIEPIYSVPGKDPGIHMQFIASLGGFAGFISQLMEIDYRF